MTLKTIQNGQDITLLIQYREILVQSKHVLVSSILIDFINCSFEFIDTGRPYVYLPCHPNSSWGNEPYFSNCTKPQSPKEEVKLIIVRDHSYRNLTIEQITKVFYQYLCFLMFSRLIILVTFEYIFRNK